MQFLKSTVADFQLRSRVSRVITDVTSNHRLSLKAAECEQAIALAHEHPKLVLHYLRERLSAGSGHTAMYLGILLLDILVNSCSYSFHEVLAGEDGLQHRLVVLASERAESDSQRKVRSAARNVVLDFSRTFFDDPRLVTLSLLAEQVEKRTGKKLLRSIQVERTNVHIIDPRPEDIVLISPIRRGPTGRPLVDNPSSSTILINSRQAKEAAAASDASSAAAAAAATGGSAFWVCEMCTFVNNKANERCNACGTKRPPFDCVPISSPTTTHPPSHHLYQGNVHPPSPSPSPAPAEVSDADAAASPTSDEETVKSPSEDKRAVEAEVKRATEEAEAKRVAEEAEAQRAAEEAVAEAKRAAEEAEADAKRAAEEAEAKREAEEAEAKRAAEEAEAKRVAEEAEEESETVEVPIAAAHAEHSDEAMTKDEGRNEDVTDADEEEDMSERVAEHADPNNDMVAAAAPPSGHNKRKSRKRGGK